MENKKIKILLIDNDESCRNMREFLSTQNELDIVGEITDGKEAETKIAELNPDLVIMDIVLPGQDGFVLIENLKRTLKSSCPKIIITSELSHQGFITKALTLGVNYYLIKPCSTESIYLRVKDVMGLKDEYSIRADKFKEKVIDEKISNIFITVGIPAHIKGYQFLREAIKMAINSPEIINSITKKLYPAIAERFDTSSSKVERAIRHAIEVAWNRGKIENINNIFGLKVYSSQDKPTNGEFIALVADKMLIEGA